MTLQNTAEPVSLSLQRPPPGDGLRLEYAKQRADATIAEIKSLTQGNETVVVLQLGGIKELLSPFVQWYFANLAKSFLDECTTSTLVIDVTDTGRFRYWLYDLMQAEGTFLVCYDHPHYLFVGKYPVYLEEFFHILQDGPATREELVAKFRAADSIVDAALEHLVEYRLVRLSDGVYESRLPTSLRSENGTP